MRGIQHSAATWQTPLHRWVDSPWHNDLVDLVCKHAAPAVQLWFTCRCVMAACLCGVLLPSHSRKLFTCTICTCRQAAHASACAAAICVPMQAHPQPQYLHIRQSHFVEPTSPSVQSTARPCRCRASPRRSLAACSTTACRTRSWSHTWPTCCAHRCNHCDAKLDCDCVMQIQLSAALPGTCWQLMVIVSCACSSGGGCLCCCTVDAHILLCCTAVRHAGVLVCCHAAYLCRCTAVLQIALAEKLGTSQLPIM